jgi:hypothetical protein
MRRNKDKDKDKTSGLDNERADGKQVEYFRRITVAELARDGMELVAFEPSFRRLRLANRRIHHRNRTIKRKPCNRRHDWELLAQCILWYSSLHGLGTYDPRLFTRNDRIHSRGIVASRITEAFGSVRNSWDWKPCAPCEPCEPCELSAIGTIGSGRVSLIIGDCEP